MINVSYIPKESSKLYVSSSINIIEDAFYSDLLSYPFDKTKSLKKKFNFNSTNDLNLEELFTILIQLDEDFKYIFRGYSLKNIILMKPEAIPSFIIEIESRISFILQKDYMDGSDELYNKLKSIFDYTKFQNKIITPFFKNNFFFKTCHYCNKTYTTDIVFEKKDKEIIVTYQLDHFYEKANYSYLGLSFYNFIPCCSTCNSTIKNREVKSIVDDCFSKKCIAPNNKNFYFHNKVKFKTFFAKDDIAIKDIDDFTILLKEKYKDEYKEYIRIFNLNEVYLAHRDIVLSMIKKRKKYSNARIKELARITKQSDVKVKEDLFGEHLNDKDLSKRPLSKLTQDIGKELGLI